MTTLFFTYSLSTRSGKPFFGLPLPKSKEEAIQTVINLAKERLKSPEIQLQRWFCKKYGIPPTDVRYLNYTQEELLLEYVCDALEEGALSTEVDSEGRIVSDPVLKMLEEEFEQKEKELEEPVPLPGSTSNSGKSGKGE